MVVILRVLGILSLATVFLHTAEIKMSYAEPCPVCKIEKGELKTCKGCLTQRYCSLECQKQDWPAHKEACKKASERRARLADMDKRIAERRARLAEIDKRIAEWPVRPPAKSISAGLLHTCVLDTEGKVKCRGGMSEGGYNYKLFPQPNLKKEKITQISSGYNHFCALSQKGRVMCWGNNKHGQTDVPADLEEVTQVAASKNQTCVLTAENVVHCWGENIREQVQTLPDEKTITQIQGDCALNIEGKVHCWKNHSFDKKAVGLFSTLSGTTQCVIVPPVGWSTQRNVECSGRSDLLYLYERFNSDVRSGSSGVDHTCAITQAGQLQCWGDSDYGKTAIPKGLKDVQFQEVAAGGSHTCAITAEGKVHCWGRNDRGQKNVQSLFK